MQNQFDCRRGDEQIGKGRGTTGQARATVEGKENRMEARQHNQGMVTNRTGQGRKQSADRSDAD